MQKFILPLSDTNMLLATPCSLWVPMPVEKPTPAGWSTHITSEFRGEKVIASHASTAVVHPHPSPSDIGKFGEDHYQEHKIMWIHQAANRKKNIPKKKWDFSLQGQETLAA